MVLGFVMTGIVLGLASAAAALLAGLGIGMAALAYIGGGFAGFALGVIATLLPRAACSVSGSVPGDPTQARRTA